MPSGRSPFSILANPAVIAFVVALGVAAALAAVVLGTDADPGPEQPTPVGTAITAPDDRDTVAEVETPTPTSPPTRPPPTVVPTQPVDPPTQPLATARPEPTPTPRVLAPPTREATATATAAAPPTPVPTLPPPPSDLPTAVVLAPVDVGPPVSAAMPTPVRAVGADRAGASDDPTPAADGRARRTPTPPPIVFITPTPNRQPGAGDIVVVVPTPDAPSGVANIPTIAPRTDAPPAVRQADSGSADAGRNRNRAAGPDPFPTMPPFPTMAPIGVTPPAIVPVAGNDDRGRSGRDRQDPVKAVTGIDRSDPNWPFSVLTPEADRGAPRANRPGADRKTPTPTARPGNDKDKNKDKKDKSNSTPGRGNFPFDFGNKDDKGKNDK